MSQFLYTRKRSEPTNFTRIVMHRVDRGPEPTGLAKIRDVHTSRWVEYYTKGIGTRPTDSHWRRFHNDLSQAFAGICGYCEETTKGEVDHFRPKSRFPESVYHWTNWIYSCHECNQAKGITWPPSGYVDPCAKRKLDRPERHFTFDTQTGMILPSPSLDTDRHQRARRTIDDLGLNDFHHLRKRVLSLELFSAAVSTDPHISKVCTRKIVTRFASRKIQFSSIVRAWLYQKGYHTKSLEGGEPIY